MSTLESKVVLSVGAVLRGDDAAGPYLAKLMQDNPVKGWSIIDGGQTPEDDLVLIRRNKPDYVVVVDAADMGIEAGQVRILEEEDIATDYLITTHSLPLSFLISQLKENCNTVVFLGIQPAHLDFMEPLTPEVLQAVEDIYQTLQGSSLPHLVYTKLVK